MFTRVFVITLNTYREAVRAKVLHGLFALALATAAYCVIVGQFAGDSTSRVLSNLGSASVALYGAFVAIVLSATALHRELEFKTLFPILARPLSRGEYLVGKYLGTTVTLTVFVLGNCAVFLAALAVATNRSLSLVLGVMTLGVSVIGVASWRLPSIRTASPAIATVVAVASGWLLCDDAIDDRRVLLISAGLTILEVGIVGAIALLFSSFSSPFLTAIFTLGVFLVGRSADTLAHLPARVFGETLHRMGEVLASVVPNLMLYVPERAVLTGSSEGAMTYAALAAVQAVGWCTVLLAVASVIFKKRDLA